MKTVELKGLDKTCFTEKLNNGLEVIFIPYEDKKNYFMTYATRYGSDTNCFVPVGSKKFTTVPNGIAHFLEHKMFEQEDGVDPFSFFSESGTGGNASTTFTSTRYICYGTKEFKKNLKYLINFVNEPYFTDENVEKEKGIIFLSPNCSSILVKSIDRLSILAGVPVLNRNISIPNFLRESVK